MYPSQQPANGAYAGYPVAGGADQQQQQGYGPVSGEYAAQSNGGYQQQPQSNGGGYPVQQQSNGYPQQNGGYPQQNGGYPQQNGGYPQQNGGYPQQNGGYPQQNGGYQQQSNGYQNGGYQQQSNGYQNGGGAYGGLAAMNGQTQESDYNQGGGAGYTELGANLKDVDWSKEKLVEKAQVSTEYVQVAQGRTQAEVDGWRQQQVIRVTGRAPNNPIFTFEETGFPRYMLDAFQRQGYQAPTPIQCQGWPVAMAGRDMVGVAKTGSGKTMAFGIPGLLHIAAQPPLERGDGPIMLVIAPTRELAIQIEQEITKVCPQGVKAICCYGGSPKREQAYALRARPQIIIATPGRLIDFLEGGQTNLRKVSYLVMDEADRMLDMGFEPDVRKIVGQCRPDRQTLLWSATWPRSVQNLARDFQKDIVHIQSGSDELSANTDITQQIQIVGGYDGKVERLGQVLGHLAQQGIHKAIIFVATKKSAAELENKLRSMRYFAMSIHGDKEQQARERALGQLKERERAIMVATDVAQRGLDIPNLPAVNNFDMPQDGLEDYVHRIGRTGRAGKKGLAISFFVPAKDCGHARGLINILRKAGQEVPPELERCTTMQAPEKRRYGGKGGGGGRKGGGGGKGGGGNNVPLGRSRPY